MESAKSGRYLLFLLFAFFAVSITSPLASYHYYPSGDFTEHAKAIVLAKMALLQHQFPLRVTFDIKNNPGYGLFQFYSPFPYMVAGYLCLLIKNLYIPYKLLIWSSLILGAVYMYRLTDYLLHNKRVAVLAALAYQLSPYWIININIRTDFTEAIAQGLLPIALYYSFKVFDQYQLRRFILAAVTWSLLAMTHLVTFAYGQLFMLMLFTLYTLKNWTSLKGYLRVWLVTALSYVLALWFLAPIMTTHSLLFMHPDDPFATHMFTHFAALVSLRSISALPLPAGGELGVANMYLGLGYPVLLAIGIILYVRHKDKSYSASHKMMTPLFITFLISFFAVWSPVDIWKHMPAFLYFFQFTYRILAQSMWLGVLLFAYAANWLFKDLKNDSVMIVLITILAMGSSSWLHNQRADAGSTIRNISQAYDNHLAVDYQIDPQRLHTSLLPATAMIKDCEHKNTSLQCHYTVKQKAKNILLPMLYYPRLLQVRVNNELVPYTPVLHNNMLMVGLTLKPGEYTIESKFVGLLWANWASGAAWCLALLLLTHLYVRKKLKKALPMALTNPLPG